MKGSPIAKKVLVDLYTRDCKSAKEISKKLNCSENKVHYWLNKHSIKKRDLSEAAYVKQNPTGDPFKFRKPKTKEEWFLFGLGVGLYWGEGNKKNRTAVRLGNSEPALIKYFLEFLETVYQVKKEKIRFGLQVFSDISPQAAQRFWCEALQVPPSKFGKTIVTPARGTGTYKEKTQYGVLTIYVSNVKLRNMLVGEIEKLRTMR